MSYDADVIVVGSGPAGSIAAHQLLSRGFKVLMLDAGQRDEKYKDLIPDKPFEELRAEDADQARYFLGDDREGVPSGEVKVGAQLTPPRQYICKGSDKHFPVRSDDFNPMQSLSLGGLGAGWGAASFTYTDEELEAIGIPASGIKPYYTKVADLIGLSGPVDDDISENAFNGVTSAQDPLEIDHNGKSILKAYQSKREKLNRSGFILGRTPMAILTKDLGERKANPYHDMEFWSDVRGSVFRPQYLIEELKKNPSFTYAPGHLVYSWEEAEDGVEVFSSALDGEVLPGKKAKALMLCAGAIQSGRIALNALKLVNHRTPILCNPYVYIPCLNWHTLGAKGAGRRHSLSQLFALFKRNEETLNYASALQFYSYRSLLLFKLVKEFPLPPKAGLSVARNLMNAFTIIGMHHADDGKGAQFMKIEELNKKALPRLNIKFEQTLERLEANHQAEREASKLLRRLKCFPLKRVYPGKASSIHYAGTLPYGYDKSGTENDGRLSATKRVFVGDSAPWKFLPAKGLTLTIMANAMRTADLLSEQIPEWPAS